MSTQTESVIDHEAPHQSAFVYESIRWLTGLPMRAAFRVHVDGIEHVPRTGGVVLAPTHRSNWDTIVLGVPLRRPLRAMAKIELYRNPVLGWVLRHGGAFPVVRGKGDEQAMATSLALLRAGEVLLVYPEGTRNRDGNARPHDGASRLALMSGADLVPAAVIGTDRARLWPPRSSRFYGMFGPPIEMDDLREAEDLRRAAHAATARWKVAVADLRARLEAQAALKLPGP